MYKSKWQKQKERKGNGTLNASHKSSFDKQKRSEYPTLRTFAVLLFPVLFPAIFNKLTCNTYKQCMGDK